MSAFSDYKQYREKKPEYSGWKEQREQDLANKVSYIKSNPIQKDEFNKDVERAKVVLNAVNVMDEYSQSRAEEMEQVSESVIAMASEPVVFGSMGLAMLAIKFSKSAQEAIVNVFNGNFKNIKALIPAGILYIGPSILLSVFGKVWAAKKEIQASREGRQEAMNTDLASVKQFAVLDEQQQAQVEKISQGIEVSKEDEKKIIQNANKLGIIDSVKTIFKKDNKEKYQANIKPNEAQLTEEQILEAKKDKELIQTIVEKVDIASQDYAEDTENAINIATTVATTGGFLTGAVAGWICGLIKPLTKYKGTIGTLVGIAISIGSIFYGAKLQKQASRVARFKVKQELLNNPEQLVYVDEEKYKNQGATAEPQKNRGFFENIKQIIIDNKEYNEYIKNNNAKNIKLARAKEQIELSAEQEQRARQLQQNTFNMFNKLDEKSQRYSEASEAVGEIFKSGIGTLLMIPGMIASGITTANAKSKLGKILGFVGYALSLLIPIGINFAVTKDQKNASRVANMEAIKELNDYRYFADDKVEISKEKQENNSNAKEAPKANISPMLAKLINKQQ